MDTDIQIKTSSTEIEILDLFQKSKNNTHLILTFDILSNFGFQCMNLSVDQLKQLTSLVDLTIIIKKQCALNQQEYYTLGNGLSQLKALNILRIQIEESCLVSSECILELSQGIKKQINLIQFDIQIKQNNDVGEVGCKSLSESIQQFVHLQKLSIQIEKSTQICHKSITYILQCIKYSVNLNELKFNIDFSNLNETAIIELSDSLAPLPNLRSLELAIEKSYYSYFSVISIFKVISDLKLLSKLKFDLLNSSLFIMEDQYSISQYLSKLTNIVELSITNLFDSFSQEISIEFFKSLSKMDQIKSLQLTIYRIYEINLQSSQQMGDYLRNLKNLNNLKLTISRHSNYKDEFIYEIIDSLQVMSELENIELDIQTLVCSRSSLRFSQILQNFQKLKTFTIDISENFDLRKESIEQFAKSLMLLNNLNELTFNCSKQINYSPIMLSLQNLKQLKILTLQLYQIDNQDILINLGVSLQNISTLKSLNIQLYLYQQFNENILLPILNGVKIQDLLEIFQFQIEGYDNQSQEEIQCHFEGIKSCKKLKEIILNVNYQLDNKLSQEFKESLLNLEQLESIQFNFTQNISIQNLSQILSGIQSKKFKKLNLTLQIFKNDQEQNEEGLINILSHLIYLEELCISGEYQHINNKFNIYKVFLHNIQNIKLLTNLSMDFRDLTVDDECFQAFQNCFQSLQNLQTLSLNLNFNDQEITSQGINNFYSGLQSLRSLKNLFITIFSKHESSHQVLNSIYKLEDISTINASLNNNRIFQMNEENQFNQKLIPFQNDLVQSNFSQACKLSSLSVQFNINYNKKSQLILDFFKNLKILKYLKTLSIEQSSELELQNEYISEFGKSLLFLSNLQEFNFYIYSKIYFSNQALDDFAIGFAKLIKLQTLTINLDLDKSSENSEGLANIFKSLQYIKNLQHLNLYLAKKISQSSIINIGESISQLKELQTFNISINMMQGTMEEGISSLGKCFKSTPELSQLSILLGEKVLIGEKGAISLGQGFSNLKNLINFELTIFNNINITDKCCSEIFKSLSQLHNLLIIRINFNQLNGISSEPLQHLAQMLSRLKKLQSIQIEIQINEGIKQAPIQLFEFYQDQKIEMCEVSLTNYDSLSCQYSTTQQNFYLLFSIKFYKVEQSQFNFQSLLKTLEFLPTQTKMVIKIDEYCKISQENYKIFSQQLQSFKTRDFEIVIKDNNLESQSPIEITNGFSQMKNLQILSIKFDDNNEISGKVIEKIVKNICSCNQVLELNICIKLQQDLDIHVYFKALQQLNTMKKLRSLSFSSDTFFEQIINRQKILQQFCKKNIRLVNLKVKENNDGNDYGYYEE